VLARSVSAAPCQRTLWRCLAHVRNITHAQSSHITLLSASNMPSCTFVRHAQEGYVSDVTCRNSTRRALGRALTSDARSEMGGSISPASAWLRHRVSSLQRPCLEHQLDMVQCAPLLHVPWHVDRKGCGRVAWSLRLRWCCTCRVGLIARDAPASGPDEVGSAALLAGTGGRALAAPEAYALETSVCMQVASNGAARKQPAVKNRECGATLEKGAVPADADA
jgi:hypothetical protein